MKIFIDNVLEICDKSFNKTPQGYLLLEGIISRSGSQTYLDIELGVGSSGKQIIVDRPVDEVIDPLSISSFMNMPVTDEHPENGEVTKENFRKYSRGVVMDAEATPSNQIKASMVIFDSELIAKIEAGKRELSAGYSAEIEFSDDGKSAVQRKIRGNHVAFVDAARCGKECSIFDSKPNTGELKMAKMKIKNIEYEVADSIAPAVSVLVDENEKFIKLLSDSKDENEKLQAISDAAHKKIKEMEDEDDEDEDEKEKKISDAAHVLLSVLQDASKIIKDYDAAGKTIMEIKRDAVCDSSPELKEKSDAYVEAMFDIMVKDFNSKDLITDSLKFQQNNGGNFNDAEKARNDSIERKQNAWKNKGEKK